MLDQLNLSLNRLSLPELAVALCLGLVTAACGGISFDGGEGCSVDGTELEKGDSLKVDCNTCTCLGDDELACTLIGCEEETDDGDPCDLDGDGSLAHGATRTRDCESCTCDDGELSCEDVCAPTESDCELSDGEVIEDGESFEVNCNTCLCDDGIIECTEKACESDTCELDGDEWLDDGDVIEVGCNTCECTEGTLSCTEIACNSQCVVDGDSYEDGDAVPGDRDCQTCFCDEGEVACLEIGCTDDSCQYDGQIYEDGESFDDDCNACVCLDGQVSCTERACEPGACSYEGNDYQDGESFQDACNDCECDDGVVSCTDVACGCEQGGVSYDDGETLPAPRACESCVCDNGDIACVSIGCSTCVDESGSERDEGEQWAGEDACSTCTCGNGGIQCEFSGCPDPECEGVGAALPNGTQVELGDLVCECVDGEARCLEPGACEVRGVLYENGSSVPDPNSCNQCSCVDGEITGCTEIACPVVVIEPCAEDHDAAEDYRHEAVSIDDGLLTIDVQVSGTCAGPHEFDVCYDPIDTSGSTPQTALHLIHHDPGAACDDIGMQVVVVDLYPFTADEGQDEVFFDLGRHRLLYLAP